MNVLIPIDLIRSKKRFNIIQYKDKFNDERELNMNKFNVPEWKNNGKIKLMIIVGTRPEIIRLSAVINKCREYFDCILAHTGQNYDYNLNDVFFKSTR